ncbi:response regulator [Vibrio intestinalis]|uniref:response regulator n=1 Tax=Vibrio intestinalis TaxID=2933291 RepID=UPI0021A599D8|nr:response regulator [Vibrio intestinalis]
MKKADVKYIKQMKVLIVDDSSTALLLLKQQLLALGLEHNQITTVERYQNAIKAIESRHFDVLILDYHLEQNLTGYELAMLLYRNRLIGDSTGVLMISGDARQETVLTALSGKVRHFVTKPLSNSSLAEKLLVIHRESQKLVQINQYLFSHRTVDAATLFEMINRSGFSISLEAHLIEHFMQQNQWDLLDVYITLSSTSCHASKMCAIAHLLHRDNNTTQALEELHQFLIENPLSIRVIDTISQLYADSEQHEQAAIWAVKAFELTPSIGERASHASQLLAVANKKAPLYKVGLSYAQHMSMADVNWLKAVIGHFQSLEKTYLQTESTTAKTDLLHHANQFIHTASRRLTPKRIQHLQSIHLIFQCHVLIHENNEALGHRKLLQSLANYYDELFECPVILLLEYLPALDLFGEREISRTLVSVLKSRGANPNNIQLPKRFFQNEDAAYSGFDFHQNNSELVLYQDLLKQYPHSSEAKIQYLHAQCDRFDCIHDEHLNKLLSELNSLDLPPNWNNWVVTGKQHGYSAPPPNAFSFAATKDGSER